ncbi:MAG: hypothetical protein SFU25_08220, partial [Candidatus Caenarcaniphilales bacterium]|nr:hypothetical protein [Candidatus Caenarcaniphilales bacterium]
MYTLVLNGNFNSSLPTSAHRSSEPVTYGSAKNDSFLLDDHTRGIYLAGGGDDTFTYNQLGRLNTSLYGGRGEDTIAFQNLKVQDVLQKLLDNRYSFIQQQNGFSLRTQDGQEIRVADVEKVAFADRTFDLRNDNDVRDLVKALNDKKIRVIDESKALNSPEYCPPSEMVNSQGLNRLIPVGNSYASAQAGPFGAQASAQSNLGTSFGSSSGLFNNVWPQASASSQAYAQSSPLDLNSLFQPAYGGNTSYGIPQTLGSPYSMGYAPESYNSGYNSGFPMSYAS